jgi:hypothetical protein
MTIWQPGKPLVRLIAIKFTLSRRPPLDLTDDGRAILAELLRETIERNAFLSPRTRSFLAILDKLDPSGRRCGADSVGANLPNENGRPEGRRVLSLR